MIKTKRDLREAENKNHAIQAQLQNSERQVGDLQLNNAK